jgi:hypothetical protein
VTVPCLHASSSCPPDRPTALALHLPRPSLKWNPRAQSYLVCLTAQVGVSFAVLHVSRPQRVADAWFCDCVQWTVCRRALGAGRESSLAHLDLRMRALRPRHVFVLRLCCGAVVSPPLHRAIWLIVCGAVPFSLLWFDCASCTTVCPSPPPSVKVAAFANKPHRWCSQALMLLAPGSKRLRAPALHSRPPSSRLAPVWYPKRMQCSCCGAAPSHSHTAVSIFQLEGLRS